MSGHAILSVDTVHEGWTALRIATVRLPDGQEIRREIEDHGGAIAVLPFDPERRVATLVRQFRPPVFFAGGEETILEVPAGCLEAGETAEICAVRELFEETGLRLNGLQPLGPSWSMPGISTERMHLFLATYREADRAGPGGGLAEEHEDVAPVEIALAELMRMAEDGRLPDQKTLLLLLWLRLRRPELFI